MGRTLEALRQAETPEANQPEVTSPAAGTPQLQVVTGEEPDEEMPYIEVGGRGKAVEGSPDVLAAPALRPVATRAPALAAQGPLSVAFRPCPATPPPAPRMAPEVIAYHQPEHEVSKQYRALLGQILPEPGSETGRALLFTALTPGAGVTTALLNLAVTACAAEHREVVVVDTNLQRPALAGRVGLPAGPGLRDLLAGSAALDQAVRGTVQERLHVLTAGSERAAGLNAEAVRWVVAWLRQRFELVFLDGPAWHAEAVLAPLVAAADRVLLVLDHADVERPDVRAAVRGIARLGGQLGGLLVTR
jgi:Mrp family chromosome partitioning ATPase